MLRQLRLVLSIVVLALVVVVPVLAAAPNFSPAIYADGRAWGTKGLSELPVPNETMKAKSFDVLYIFTNAPPEQLLVGEAGPRNPDYNGGRWQTKGATWTAAGMAAHDPLPILMSDEAVLFHASLGHIDITDGSPDAHPDYFECPLLPVK
jgi:hypothetical protein